MSLKNFVRQLRFQLHSASNRQEHCVFFEAVRYRGPEFKALREFISDIQEEGYSVRTIMLDSDRILRYRVFLPKGSRLQDQQVVEKGWVPYEDPTEPSFKKVKKMQAKNGVIDDDTP